MSSHSFRRRHSRLLAVSALAAVTVALSACTGTATAPGQNAEPQAGGILDVAFWPDNAAFSCVDPFQTYWAEHRTVVRNIASSLTDQDPETGEIVPWLATEWTINDDATEYTFTLRDDVTFSDGTVFDATSVKTAFDNNAQTLAENPGSYGGLYIAHYASTTVVDPSTVIVAFSSPNSAFLQATSTTNLAILAASSYAATPTERCLGDVVGSGPFVLDSYRPGEGITLSKRAGYDWASPLAPHAGDAYLDGIEISYVAEDSVRVGQLTSGEIDVAWPRNPFTEEQTAQITGTGDTVQSRAQAGVASNFFVNSAGGRPLAEDAVRRALQVAIDRTEYATTIYGADFAPLDSIYNGTTPYRVQFPDELDYDAAAAAELLDDAGWALGDDGYRHRDGSTLTLTVPITAATPGDQLVQDQLKRIGIELELSTITAAERSAVLDSGSYDLITTYFSRADPGVLQWILDERVASSKALAANATDDAQAATVQDLFDRGTAAVSDAQRAEIYGELQSYLLDQAIVIPLFERVNTVGVDAAIHDVRFTSEAFGDFSGTWIEQ